MPAYRTVFTREASDFICRASHRDMRVLDDWLDRIERLPGTPGDYTELDDTSRELQVVVLDKFAITYWPDHAVREVRIVRIETPP